MQSVVALTEDHRVLREAELNSQPPRWQRLQVLPCSYSWAHGLKKPSVLKTINTFFLIWVIWGLLFLFFHVLGVLKQIAVHSSHATVCISKQRLIMQASRPESSKEPNISMSSRPCLPGNPPVVSTILHRCIQRVRGGFVSPQAYAGAS